MVISNEMEAAEQSGIIRVDESDHFAENWIPPFEHRNQVKVRKSEKFSDFYELYECIGEGKFGQVYRCVEKKTQLTLAAKTIRIKRDADRAQIENEVAIMTQMKHKCIAQIYDAFQTSTNDVILIMEIVEGGELFDRVADDSYILTELAVGLIVHQLCEAISYIHSQNIIHLDLKPENIMCMSLEGNQIKLIDFGLAHHYDGQSDLLFMAGTPEFAAPEVIKFEPLDFHTDMWSVGVITYILLSGQSPFLGSNVALTYNNVERGEWSFCEEFEENGISRDAKDFISKLLIVDKSKRMLPGDCLKHPWIVSCRKRATRATEEKPLDTGKLRSYVRNKHFRRLVFGVLFINTVLKMMNAMQERKSENGIAYVKSMYNLAGRKKRDGRDGASPIATTSADISLKTEGHNGVAAASVSNDGTPKVLESIRIEKRTPNLPNLPESTAKVKRKPVETGKTPKCDPKKKAAAAAPKSAPASTESADIAKKSAAAKKKDMGSVDSLVSNALEKISNKAKTSSKLAQPPQANKIPWNSSSKETNETSEKSVAKTAAAVKQIGKTEESMPGKSREDEKNDALKVPSAKNTFASKMANSLEKNAAPLSLPVISVPPRTLPLNPDGNHETKSGATTGAKKVEEKTSDPAILDKTKSVQNVKQKDSKASMPTTLSNGTSTVSTSSVKTQIAAPDQSPPKTVSSTDNNLTVLSKRSGKTSSPCPPMRSDSSQKASAPAKTKCEAKLPVLAKNVDAPKPKDRPASAPNPTNLESTKSILYEVVEKVSQEFVALRVLSKCKLRKVDQLATGPSTPPTGPTPALKPTRKQQQNVAVNAQQAPRTVDALGVSNIKTTISESESFDKQRSQKNTVPITAEKKTTTESKTKVTSKTVKKQTSIRSAGIEENESTEASRCKVKHTTSRKTEEEDVCNTVLENGQLEWSKKNSQKGLVETTSREVKALRGQQELKQKQKIEVIHVNKPKNAKTQVSGSAIEVSKRATFGVVVDKKTPEKPPLGRCTLEVKNDMKVKKLNDGKTETFVVEVSQKKQLTKKPAENGQKTTDRSGFMSDDEPATNLKKSAKKIHKSNDSLFDLEFPIKPLSKKIVTFSKEVLDDKSHSKEQKSGVAGGFGLMKMKSESTLHKKRFSVDVAKSSDDICSSASGKPRASVPTTDVEYSFANLRKQLENRIEEEKSGHMWKSSTELRFTSTNSSNAKRAMNKWLSMEKHLGN